MNFVAAATEVEAFEWRDINANLSSLKPPPWYLKVPCEKNRIITPRKKFAQCVESFQRQTLGVTFNSKNSQLFNYSLPKEDIFSSTRSESACGFLAGVVLSREKCHQQKPVR